ncbi:MAG: IclR family transcriptional regulator [Rhizobiaceae bacterium]|nr:IclR family transcriptional regulator [Rhizobiaceae bacterium]
MTAHVDQDPAPKFVGAVANAISILRALAESAEPAGVAVVARQTGISVSTCFNILRTLASERLVVFDNVDKTYRIGLGVLEFSVPLLGANQADLIRPELQRLSSDHKSLICLWQITERERVMLVDRVSVARTVRVDMSYGSRLPAHVGAVGRCYAAITNIDREALKQRFEHLKWQSPPSFESYLADVDQARRNGFAFDLGQLFIGVEIAASIITDTTGRPRLGISAINIAGQIPRRDLERLAIDLRNTTDWLSETLFGVAKGVRQTGRRAIAAGQHA